MSSLYKKIIICMKRAVQRLLGAIPAYHKYYLGYFMRGGFLKHYHFVSGSQWFSEAEAVRYRNEKLRRIIRHAYDNVPFYRDLFARERIDPDQFNAVEDLRKVPVINKHTVKDQYERFKAVHCESFKPIINKTSGSTGAPCEILIDQQVNSFVHALVWRHYNWAGCRFQSKSVYMGPPFGYATGKVDSENLYQFDATGKILKVNTALISDETLPELCALIGKFQPDHIHAYPSLISIFAQYLLKNNSYVIRPRSIILRSEKLYPECRELIKSIFHCPCFELYGMYEYVIFASECECRNLHLSDELGVTEIIKDGRVCPAGETGEIVATTLLNRSMPLIRYATGDYGRIKQGSCDCGRKLPMIEITGSREKDLIVTEKGYFNVMSGLPLVMGANGGINQVQFYQKDKKNLVVRLVKKYKSGDLDEGKIKQRLSDYLRHSINISIAYVDSIPRTQAGKYKYVDSEVPFEV